MKKQLPILLILVFLYSLNSMAKVITVNNRLDSGVADYPSLQLAYDNASASDTLLVYPSETTYAGIDISKKIFLIGNGFTSSNNLPITTISGIVNFLEGSGDSSIESFGGLFNITVTNANNISISRNDLKGLIIENSFNTLLLGNRINGSQSNSALIIKGNSLVEAANNFISRTGMIGSTITIETSSVLNISNSIITDNDCYCSDGYAISGGIVKGKNNIIRGLISSIVDFDYSIHFSTPSDFSSIFIDFPNSNYHLSTGSPAIGTGENSTDMGIYGGDTPFIDGGYPDIPIIYYLDVPLKGSQKDGINVTIKAKSNK